MTDKGSPFRTAQFKYEQGGQVAAYVRVHKDLSARTLVKVAAGIQGYRTAPLEHPVQRYYVGCPDRSFFTGEHGWIQIGGPCERVVLFVDADIGEMLHFDKHSHTVECEPPDQHGVALHKQFAYITKRHEDNIYNIYLIPELIYDLN